MVCRWHRETREQARRDDLVLQWVQSGGVREGRDAVYACVWVWVWVCARGCGWESDGCGAVGARLAAEEVESGEHRFFVLLSCVDPLGGGLDGGFILGVARWPGAGEGDLAWCFLAFLLFLGSGGFGFVSFLRNGLW